MGGSAEDEAEELLLPPSAIEAVDELGEVAGQVFPAHAMERSPQPGLEVAEDAVDPRQDISRSGRVLALNDPFMIDTDLADPAATLKRIGAHRGVVCIDGPPGEGVQVILEGESLKNSEASAPGWSRREIKARGGA
jgi:hypothetical protein